MGVAAATASRRRFGAFGGVFTPCTLTILGVIMFLRFGQVVGNAGIWQALLIVILAKTITLLTALSLSAIATNSRVEGGGAYFMISRSLGIEAGGAIGFVFFLSQAISVALYVIGFSEALLATVPGLPGDLRVVGSVVNLAVLICVYIGAGWTIKLQYVILGLLGLAIGSFLIGAVGAVDPGYLKGNWRPTYAAGEGFFTMFALFFPAVTGVMAGANMSGDLRDPARAIPRGTLAAIGATGLVYIALILLLGVTASWRDLRSESLILARIAIWSPAILIGVFAATLSSALGSMMGAPRILQAMAKDGIDERLRPFAVAGGRHREPRRAIALSFVIAQAGVMIGDLNAIAPIITMFFLITYGALNLATFAESFTGNPSWRPTFRWSHWTTALAGALLCLATMFVIDPVWATGAILVMFLIYQWLQRQNLESTWGDVYSGAALERVRRNLLFLDQERYHAKNWRPTILALGVAREDRLHLAAFSRWLAGPHGILYFGQVVIGPPERHAERQTNHEKVLRRLIAEQELEAFAAVTCAADLSAGVNALVQCTGVGALRPNLVLFGWNEDPERRERFAAAVRTVRRLQRSVVILRETEDRDPWQAPPGPIDVWWWGRDNGPLMLLLAHLLIRNDGWRPRAIRLLRMVPDAAAVQRTHEHLQQLSREARIPTVIHVVIGTDFRATVSRVSGDSALVILGLRDPLDTGDDLLGGMKEVVSGLPRVLLVHSAGGMSLGA
ncbi:MAG: amino acid permease [Planctomycetota bacterium]